jgi:hypothetical protein
VIFYDEFISWAPAQHSYNPGTEMFAAFVPWNMFLVVPILGHGDIYEQDAAALENMFIQFARRFDT